MNGKIKVEDRRGTLLPECLNTIVEIVKKSIMKSHKEKSIRSSVNTIHYPNFIFMLINVESKKFE